jgi:hypothetical protein
MISYVKNFKQGNDCKTINAEDFIDMIQKLPAYEFTGSETATTNLYFDIDDEDDTYDAADLKTIQDDWEADFLTVWPEAKIAIGTSHGIKADGKRKNSWRFWIPNIRARKCDIKYAAQLMNERLKKECDTRPQLDTVVYDDNRKMRCVGTSKDGENRPLILVKGELKDTLITLENEGAILLPEIAEATPKPRTIADVMTKKSSSVDETRFNMFVEAGLLDAASNGNRKGWIDVGFALYTTFGSDGYKLFDAFSKRSSKYDAHDCFTEWANIKGTKKTPKTFGSIMYMAKMADQTKFNQIIAATNSEKESIVETEDDAAQIIFERTESTLISYRGRIFMKIGNVWSGDKFMVENAIDSYITKSNIYRGSAKGDKVLFVKNYSTIQNIKKLLLTKVVVERNCDELYKKFHETTKGKICFTDGVLDFDARTFTRWEDLKEEVYSTMCIQREFAEYFAHPDEHTISEVEERVFNNLYGNSVQTAFQFLGRAITGHVEDKMWATYQGSRDCGKGVEFDILQSAFTSYIQSFNLNNLLYCRDSKTVETSKDNYWLLDLEFARLAISQETPEDQAFKIRGEKLKKIQGGGDEIQARRNYDRVDSYITLDTTFYMKGNHELHVDTKDCNEHRIEFASAYQFKSQEEIDEMPEELRVMYRVGDPNIRNKCKTDEWANACVMLLYRKYIASPVKIEIEKSEDVANTESAEILAAINSAFILDKDSIIRVEDAYNHIKLFMPNLTNKKASSALEQIGIKKKKITTKTSEYYGKFMFSGISIRPLKQEGEYIDS